MDLIKSLVIILGAYMGGLALEYLVPLTIPGPIYGMAILLFLLILGWVKEEDIGRTCDLLVKYMALYFIAPAVGIMESFHLIKDVLVPYLGLIIISSLLTLGVTGLVVKKIIGDGHGK